MSRPGKPPPSSEREAGAKPSREDRLARALRANLARRKAQARQREDEPPGESPKRA